jgi:hypothetical protein
MATSPSSQAFNAVDLPVEARHSTAQRIGACRSVRRVAPVLPETVLAHGPAPAVAPGAQTARPGIRRNDQVVAAVIATVRNPVQAVGAGDDLVALVVARRAGRDIAGPRAADTPPARASGKLLGCTQKRGANRQLGLLPERGDERRSALHGFASAAGEDAEPTSPTVRRQRSASSRCFMQPQMCSTGWSSGAYAGRSSRPK